IATVPTGASGWMAAASGRPDGAGRSAGSSRTVESLSAPFDRYAGSRAGVVTAVPSIAAASTARKRLASTGEAGLGPCDPTDPGTATVASTTMSAVIATTLGRRTSTGTLAG